MDEWHSLVPKSNLMSLEDAHGGELLSLIENAHRESQNLISSINQHAPLVAQQLIALDTHYANIFQLFEKALRTKTDRPKGDLEQLAILAEFNQWNGYRGNRTNIKVTLVDHLVEYGIKYGGGQGHLPAQEYLTKEGQLKVVDWYAERTPSGKPRIVERLENGERSDGYCVFSEVIDQTAMEEVSISELDFALMLLKDRDIEPDGKPTWHDKRICYIRSPLTLKDSWSWFNRHYPALYLGSPRTVLQFAFQYSYPFCVGQRTALQYNIFDDSVSSAICFDTTDSKYALIFYRVSINSSSKVLILEHATMELKEYREEWYISEYLKNTLDMMKYERNSVGLYDLSETHPYRVRLLQLDEIPKGINDYEEIKECVEVTFDQPQLISDGKLNLCTRIYAYKTESDEVMRHPAKAKLHFEYGLVEDIDLAKISDRA